MEGIPIARQNQILAASKSSTKTKVPDDAHVSPEDQKPGIIRRGAQAALSEIAAEFGEKLFDTLPILWEIMAQPLMNAYRRFRLVNIMALIDFRSASSESVPLEQECEQGQTIIDCLTIIRSLAPTIHMSHHPRIVGLFPTIVRALQSKFAILRQCAAQCVATLCDVITTDAMRLVVEQIVPFLADATVLTNKQGAIEVVYSGSPLQCRRLLADTHWPPSYRYRQTFGCKSLTIYYLPYRTSSWPYERSRR
jgi:TATA-binding protein-associated factor